LDFSILEDGITALRPSGADYAVTSRRIRGGFTLSMTTFRNWNMVILGMYKLNMRPVGGTVLEFAGFCRRLYRQCLSYNKILERGDRCVNWTAVWVTQITGVEIAAPSDRKHSVHRDDSKQIHFAPDINSLQLLTQNEMTAKVGSYLSAEVML
jgi:hypothetical protein